MAIVTSVWQLCIKRTTDELLGAKNGAPCGFGVLLISATQIFPAPQ